MTIDACVVRGMSRSLLSVAVLLLAACGSSLTPREAMEQFCQSLNEARLAQAERCGFAQADISPCDGPAWTRSHERLERGQISFDGSAAGACLQSARNRCGDRDSPCDHVLRGAVPPGGTCGSRDDCAEDGFCEMELACPGKCVAYPRAGERCEGHGPCAGAAWCGRDGFCHSLVEEGGRCTADLGTETVSSDSELDDVCDLGLVCEAGACVPEPPKLVDGDRPVAYGAEEDSCGNGGSIAWSISVMECGEGLYCDPSSHRCRAPLEAGRFCFASFECLRGLTCEGRTCMPLAKPGDACTSEMGRCAGGALFCWQGQCRAAPRIGESCDLAGLPCAAEPFDPLTDSSDTISARCNPATLRCEELGLPGARCTTREDCHDFAPCVGGLCTGALCVP